MRCIALLSGGKDSWYALYLSFLHSFEIVKAVTFIPKKRDSYMLHHPAVEWVSKQCELASIEHELFEISGEEEVEIEEMEQKLEEVVRETGAECLICGAVWSDYQKRRVDFIAENLGVMSYAPLWRKDEAMLLREMVEEAGFSFMITRTAAEGMEKWAGEVINVNNIQDFVEDVQKARCNVVGEGGEYESFVLYMPLFRRKLEVRDVEVVRDNGAHETIIHSLH